MQLVLDAGAITHDTLSLELLPDLTHLLREVYDVLLQPCTAREGLFETLSELVKLTDASSRSLLDAGHPSHTAGAHQPSSNPRCSLL